MRGGAPPSPAFRDRPAHHVCGVFNVHMAPLTVQFDHIPARTVQRHTLIKQPYEVPVDHLGPLVVPYAFLVDMNHAGGKILHCFIDHVRHGFIVDTLYRPHDSAVLNGNRFFRAIFYALDMPRIVIPVKWCVRTSLQSESILK